jgi:hypothetical protein
MSRYYQYRFIRRRRSYSIRELSNLIGVHRQTALRWYKSGMMPVAGSANPLIFMGYEIQKFLRGRRASRRVHLEPHQFYCMKCKSATTSEVKDLDLTFTCRTIGKNDQAVTIVGRCKTCSAKVCRFTTARRAETVLTAMTDESNQSGLERVDFTALTTDIGGQRTR